MAVKENVALKEQVYYDDRPSEYFERFHERSRTRDPDVVYEIVRSLTSLYSWTFFRCRAAGADKVPAGGPVILAPNHFSFMDHFFLGMPLRRKVRFMAKSQMFKPPLQFIYTHGGVFPVRRGARDEESFITAGKILSDGACMAMYCEGGRSRTGGVGDQGAKPGIGRLALQSGAVVVPVAIHGSSRVRNWRRGEFPPVTLLYGEPFRFERVEDPSREQSRAVAEEILGEIRTLYERLDREGRAAVLAAARRER